MAATTALYVTLATPEACPADRLRFELIEAPASTTLEISNPLRQPIIYKTISNTDKYAVRSGYGVLAIGGQKELRFTMVDAARQDILASAEEGLVLSNDRFGVVFAAVGPDLAQFLETQKGQVLKDCINSIFAQKEQFPSRCEKLSVTLVVPQKDSMSARPAKKPRPSTQPSEGSITTSRAGSALPPTAGESSSSSASEDDGGRGQDPLRPKVRPAPPPTAGGSSSESDDGGQDLSLASTRPPGPRIYSFDEVDDLGRNNLLEADATAFRAAWNDAVKITTEDVVHGLGTVALRALERGSQLLDASAPLSLRAPNPEHAHRCIAVGAGHKVYHFLLDTLDDDDDAVKTRAASYYINSARNVPPNAAFFVRHGGVDESTILGVVVLDDMAPGTELLLRHDALPVKQESSDDDVAISSSEDEGDNNGSGIDWPKVWDHKSESSLREYKVAYLRELCLELGESAEGNLYALCKTLYAYISSHQMPGAQPVQLSRRERVDRGVAQVGMLMSKEGLCSALRGRTTGTDRTTADERLITARTKARDLEEIRSRYTGLTETPPDDQLDLSTQDEIMQRTTHSGPTIYAAAHGELEKRSRAQLEKLVEELDKQNQPIFGDGFRRYDDAARAFADNAQRGTQGGWSVAYDDPEERDRKAEEREAAPILRWDASKYNPLAIYWKSEVARARDPQSNMTLAERREAAQGLLLALTGCRSVRERKADTFEVRPALLGDVADKIESMERELASDGNVIELWSAQEFFHGPRHCLRFTERTKKDPNKKQLVHRLVISVSHRIYSAQESQLLLDDLEFCFKMNHGTSSEFNDTCKAVRKEFVKRCFGGLYFDKIPGVVQSRDASFERAVVCMYQVRLYLKNRNAEFKRKYTSHRLSILQNGDDLTHCDDRTMKHAYNWTDPFWPLGKSGEPNLPSTFKPQQL